LVTGRFDGELVAFDIVLRSGPTMYDIYGRYDPALARYSPGTLVQREVLRAAIDVGAHRLDLQLGDHPYKRRWADGAYDAIDVLAAPIGGLRRAAAWQQVILGAHSGRAALRARTTASRAGRPAATGER
jgi:CelD/BcsL family acetyltransferase involved in cellulose biosynthesis